VSSSIIAASSVTPATITVIEDIAQSIAILKSHSRASSADAGSQSIKEFDAAIEKIVGSSAEEFWSMYRVGYSIEVKKRSSVRALAHAPIAVAASASSSSSSPVLPPSSVSAGGVTVSIVAINPQALPPLRQKKRSAHGNGNASNELKVEGEADNETEWRLQSELT